MDAIASYLSDYTTALSFKELPADVVHQAKRLLVDTLGCAIGGYPSEPQKSPVRWLSRCPAAGRRRSWVADNRRVWTWPRLRTA
jgi:2-methylcitrate dehydratase PrpD